VFFGRVLLALVYVNLVLTPMWGLDVKIKVRVQ
jgi:hypothetical protein